jgi:hypothetical protein
MSAAFLACLDIFPSIFLWKKPLPFKFLASALILYGDTYMGYEIYVREPLRKMLKSD